jgi:hypothetical protein
MVRLGQKRVRTIVVGESYLKQRVSCYNLQKALEPFPSALDDLVREAIREDLAGQGWDVDSRTFPLENVSEGLKVRAVAKIAR